MHVCSQIVKVDSTKSIVIISSKDRDTLASDTNAKYKLAGDKGRKHVMFAPGDLVCLHLRKDSDRGKGVPSFDEMMDIALVEVDFDDPTTNVRGRRALAIAKPTSRGY